MIYGHINICHEILLIAQIESLICNMAGVTLKVHTGQIKINFVLSCRPQNLIVENYHLFLELL